MIFQNVVSFTPCSVTTTGLHLENMLQNRRIKVLGGAASWHAWHANSKESEGMPPQVLSDHTWSKFCVILLSILVLQDL